MTALHVIHGCDAIEPTIVSCADQSGLMLQSPWTARHPIEILVWKDFDLAAIVIPDEERAPFLRRLRPFHVAASSKQETPRYQAALDLIAKAGTNVCPRIPAVRRDVFKARQLYRTLNAYDYYKLFGSLAEDAVLMSYQSTAVKGTSGGPVVWVRHDPNEIVAIHLGGQDGVMQWGVLVSREALLANLQQNGARAVARLDSHNSTLSIEQFEPPHQLIDADLSRTASFDVALHPDGLLAVVETSTPVDPFGAVSNSLQLGWSHQWFSPSFAPLATAVGTRVLVGGAFGQYRSPVVLDDRHKESPRNGTGRLPFLGGFGELAAELSFARLLPVHYTIALGMRAGVSHQVDVGGSGNSIVWGPVLSGQAKWRWNDGLSGVVQLHVTVEKIPVATCAPGCVGLATMIDSIWDVWAGVGLGVEISP